LKLDDKLLLVLDVKSLGISLDDLFSWTPVLQVASFIGKPEKEAAAKRDPLTMARRYDVVARNFKQAAIILRLQVRYARTEPGRRIQKNVVVRIWGMLEKADKNFEALIAALNKSKSDIFPDFSLFGDAPRFFVKHICEGLDAELGDIGKWRKMKELAAGLLGWLRAIPGSTSSFCLMSAGAGRHR